MTHVVPGHALRRSLLLGSAAMLIVGLSPSHPARASFPIERSRSDWRFCGKCNALFHGPGVSNHCPAGGPHAAEGHEFDLPYDRRETATVQTRWVCCKYCSAMFFNGYRQKGRCPVRRGYQASGHVADPTFQYALPHDVSESSRTQAGWRFCNKCFSLFFDGHPSKGCCQAGSGHVAQGYSFALPYAKRSGPSAVLQSQQDAVSPPK